MSQPGWYSDPYGGGGLRWWDGAVWTQHARAAPPPPSGPPVPGAPPAHAGPPPAHAAPPPAHAATPPRNPQPPAAPVPAAPAAPASGPAAAAGPVFNMEYHRKFHVWADQHTLGVNGRTIPIADIRWVAHWVTRKTEFKVDDPTLGNFRYDFKAGVDPSRSRGDVRAEFWRRARDKEDPEAWTVLMRFLRERVEPGIVARMDARIRRGQPIDFSRRTHVHPGGVDIGRDSFPWAEVQSAKDHAGRVWLYVRGHEKPVNMGLNSVPNGVLITPLVNLIAARHRG